MPDEDKKYRQFYNAFMDYLKNPDWNFGIHNRLIETLDQLFSCPDIPVSIFYELYFLKCYNIYLALARNPSTPPEILGWLAEENDETITNLLCANPNTPLDFLISKASYMCKSYLPTCGLSRLAPCSNAHHKYRALRNPSLPVDVILAVFEDELKMKRNMASASFYYLCSRNFIISILLNPNCPEEIVFDCLLDNDNMVNFCAQEVLKKKQADGKYK
ncbi:hypothetical protein MTAT_19950 [Moorella thermoacetica]|uniref:Uncharacterized protein n=1 Tax=Neomoorella thermoacetica TaxID=1525 RepID=A0AAC9HJ73_NEOTH|nr:hypothetical protein [Moorella thermoacetica]AOQ24650.1 hypothetical protein Maut_02222 [Moorella thermoacetica]TYL12753.1 hypothetical protein MTAT_19950 [Moorella thermoacetica]